MSARIIEKRYVIEGDDIFQPAITRILQRKILFIWVNVAKHTIYENVDHYVKRGTVGGMEPSFKRHWPSKFSGVPFSAYFQRMDGRWHKMQSIE